MLKKIIFQEANLDRLGEIEDTMINQMGLVCQEQNDMSCTIEKDVANKRITVTTLELGEQMN